jgi:hypothetical protein
MDSPFKDESLCSPMGDPQAEPGQLRIAEEDLAFVGGLNGVDQALGYFPFHKSSPKN